MIVATEIFVTDIVQAITIQMSLFLSQHSRNINQDNTRWEKYQNVLFMMKRRLDVFNQEIDWKIINI